MRQSHAAGSVGRSASPAPSHANKSLKVESAGRGSGPIESDNPLEQLSDQDVPDNSHAEQEEEVIVESRKQRINKSTFKPPNNLDLSDVASPPQPREKAQYELERPITEESEAVSPEAASPLQRLSAKHVGLRVEKLTTPDLSEERDDSPAAG